VPGQDPHHTNGLTGRSIVKTCIPHSGQARVVSFAQRSSCSSRWSSIGFERPYVASM
jgi:hypothetical protein